MSNPKSRSRSSEGDKHHASETWALYIWLPEFLISSPVTRLWHNLSNSERYSTPFTHGIHNSRPKMIGGHCWRYGQAHCFPLRVNILPACIMLASSLIMQKSQAAFVFNCNMMLGEEVGALWYTILLLLRPDRTGLWHTFALISIIVKTNVLIHMQSWKHDMTPSQPDLFRIQGKSDKGLICSKFLSTIVKECETYCNEKLKLIRLQISKDGIWHVFSAMR